MAVKCWNVGLRGRGLRDEENEGGTV